MVTRERQAGRRMWPIGPADLDSYLTTVNPELPKTPQEKSFGPIFDKLRGLPQEQQEALLIGFLADEANFPKGEKIARFLVKVNNIDWFNNSGTINMPEIQKVVDGHYSRLKTRSQHPILVSASEEYFQEISEKHNQKPRYGFVDSYDASGAVWHAIRHSAVGTVTDEDTVRHMAFEVVHHNAQRKLKARTGKDSWEYLSAFAAWDAQHAVSWMLVEDDIAEYGPNIATKYDRGNPWEVLYEGIWDQGLAFVESYQLKPIIFVPPVK